MSSCYNFFGKLHKILGIVVEQLNEVNALDGYSYLHADILSYHHVEQLFQCRKFQNTFK